MFKQINSSVSLHKPVAVLFDIDNTLYEYEPADEAGNSALREEVKSLLQIPEKLYDTAFQQARQKVKERLADTASGHSRLLYIQKSLEILGLKSKPLLSLYLEEIYWRAYFQKVTLFPGALETFELLRAWDIPLGIVTDLTTRLQLRKLVYLNLEHYFDVVVTSEETGADKPDVSNFELALSKLQLNKDSGQIWMIGDDTESDVLGGKTIGAVTFQKLCEDANIEQDKASPDFAFTDFRALNEFVENSVAGYSPTEQ